MNTKLLLDGLRAHYRKPGEAQDGEVLLTEVTAPGSSRSCDLLRIGMWASRGLGIDVHELKVSRSDWLRELDDPAKAEAWWPYCNRFWVVAPRGVVKHEELPGGWGLLNPPVNANHRRFKVAVKPADKIPELTLALFTAIVKRTDNTRLAEMDRLRQAHQNATREAVMAERARCEERGLSPEAERKLKAVAQLEELLGVELTDSPFGWGGAKSLHAIGPRELATAIREYTHDHVALQRRRQQLDNDQDRLARSLRNFLYRVEQAAN